MKKISLFIITGSILIGLSVIILFSLNLFYQIKSMNQTINQGTELIAGQRQLKYTVNEILYGSYLGVPIQMWDRSFNSFKTDFEHFMNSEMVKKISTGNAEFQTTYETAWNHWTKLEDINRQARFLLVEYMESESYDNIGIYLQYLLHKERQLSPLIQLLKSENSFLQYGFENTLFSLIQSLKKETERMNNRFIILTGAFSFAFFLIIILALTGYIIRIGSINKQLDGMVRIRTRELADKNREIMESITCASTIQQSMLMKEEDIKTYFEDLFILWKPRDIVGGDFYWFYGMKDSFLLALVDCTGHGVPGALMTMTVNSILQRIVKDFVSNDPARILGMLNLMTRETVHRTDSYALINNGLDISLIYYNPGEQTLLFSGARHILFYVQDDQIKTIKGNKASIGESLTDKRAIYTNHKLHTKNIKTFYLTSDGLLDQRGGQRGFPFGKKKFKNLLLTHHTADMENQKKIIFENYLSYINSQGFTQLDDITVIGFRL